MFWLRFDGFLWLGGSLEIASEASLLGHDSSPGNIMAIAKAGGSKYRDAWGKIHNLCGRLS